MHEISLCTRILRVIEEQAREQAFRRVLRVRLEVGKLAGVEVEALRFGFNAVMRDTIAAGAALEIVELPGRGRCLDCDTEVAISARYDPCPQCGEFGLAVIGGNEMRILDLEVA